MRDTIKNHKDFIMTDENPTAKSVFFIIRMKPCVTPEKPRYGVTATKKTFKLAVHRNRAKRLLRDWVRFNEKHMRPDMDYVFIARHPILDATREDGRAAMERALKHLKKTQNGDATE
ncbi:MAG: ribonuclease P protein component [Alphaproteobacteria bacterium]|nr:ribonuclease P protein component [Alphaproteobacteria bacterium]